MSEKEPALLPLFRSAHQLRILGHLFVTAGHEWSISDIAAQTRVPQQTVSREIARLVRAGILTSRNVGRTRLVRADERGPYFDELHALLLKVYGPQTILSRLFADVNGVDEAFVFGSWARRHAGEHGPAPADVDVLVVGRPDVDHIYGICAEAQTELGMEVNPVVLTPDEWRRPRSKFVEEIRRGPLVEIVARALRPK